MHGYRVTGRAVEQFCSARLIGRDFKITIAVKQGKQLSWPGLAIGAGQGVDPLAADVQASKTGRIESASATADGGANVAEMVDALNLPVQAIRSWHGGRNDRRDQFPDDHRRTDIRKRASLRKARDHQGHDVTTVEGVTCARGQEVGVFYSVGPFEFLVGDEQGKDAVVRGNEHMPRTTGRENGSTAAHPGIDHDQVDGPNREKREAGADGDGGGDHVPGGNGVAQVDEGCGWAPLEQGALKLAGIGVLQAEIGGQGDDRSFLGAIRG